MRPIMVHRAIPEPERFVGGLIEHFGGKFFWIAPSQVAVILIREEHADYAGVERLESELFRLLRCSTPAT